MARSPLLPFSLPKLAPTTGSIGIFKCFFTTFVPTRAGLSHYPLPNSCLLSLVTSPYRSSSFFFRSSSLILRKPMSTSHDQVAPFSITVASASTKKFPVSPDSGELNLTQSSTACTQNYTSPISTSLYSVQARSGRPYSTRIRLCCSPSWWQHIACMSG